MICMCVKNKIRKMQWTVYTDTKRNIHKQRQKIQLNLKTKNHW